MTCKIPPPPKKNNELIFLLINNVKYIYTIEESKKKREIRDLLHQCHTLQLYRLFCALIILLL